MTSLLKSQRFPRNVRPLLSTLVALLPLPMVAQAEEKALPPIDFAAYWRLGYQTDLNPLQTNTSTQGVSIPTSRHMRDPNYFDLQLGKRFDNGLRAQFTLDSEGVTPHQDSKYWGASSPAETSNLADLSKRDLRVRDLYIELPAGETKIWAGARRFEWEDIRIFDFLNPFNVNGYGVGAIGYGANVSLTVEDTRRPVTPEGATENVDVPLKDVSLNGRYEIALTEKSSLKPMASFKQFGSNPSEASAHIEGSSALKVGGIYSAWGDTHWANLGLWFESNPIDPTGKESGTNTALGVMASNSYEFGDFGLLSGIWGRYDSFKNEVGELKISDDQKSLIPKDDKKTNNNFSASFGLQPVFYATDNVHLALDLNYAYSSKKLEGAGNNQANAYFITPIIRYSLAKNTIGNPHIYTSVTYGSYDWQSKTDAAGKATDALVTTQTGFEAWF